MALAPEISKSASAVFVPTDELVTAVAVTTETKQGPWECPGEGCGLPLTHVRGTLAYDSGLERWKRAPHFQRKERHSLHSKSCNIHYQDEEVMQKQRELAKSPRINDVVLLQLGQHPPTEERLPAETPVKTGSGGPDYAARVGTVSRLLAHIQAMGGEDQMNRHFYRHNGVNYQWDQIAYRAEHDEFVRLKQVVAALMNHDEYRPWFIRGVIQEGPKASRMGEGRHFLLIGSSSDARVPKVRAFFTLTPEFRLALDQISPGNEVAFLLSSVRQSDRADGVMGTLVSPVDLVPVA